MKRMKRLVAMVFTLCLLVTMLSTVVQAATYARGTCGKRLNWTLDGNGTLTISGTGAMDTWYWEDTPWYKNKDAIKKVVIKYGVTTIGSTAFNYCKNLSSVTIPDSVTAIDWCAFSYCTNLTSITIPNSVTSIGDSAFKYCYSLQSIAIPDSVISLGETIFSNCISLERVTFGKGVASISYGMFDMCESLFNITIPRNVRSIGEAAFSSCGLTSITIPDSVTTISAHAFNSCTSLVRVTIGNGVSSIGDFAFRGCISLKNITIPDGVTSIGNGAFTVCSSLTSAVIGDGVTDIGDSAFEHCYKLQSVMIPKTVTSIGMSAFASCGNLRWVYYEGTALNSANIRINLNNNQLDRAQWHYEATDIEGVEPAYHCGECNKNYWWDGSESHFTDVLTNNWQYTFAKYAVEQNLMAGTGTDAYGRVTFVPNKSITREEFVQVLYNAENKPTVTIANKFPDVANNAWYKNAVLWANENNIANGMGDGRFGVGKNITRQDLALMLYKYAALCGYSLDATTGSIFQYADGTSVSGYAKNAMDWAVTNGILSGKGTAGKPIYTFRLDPTGTATRAECAAMLKNFMTAFGL